MEDQETRVNSFLKVAARVGLENTDIPLALRAEIDAEEANAPFPSICNNGSERQLINDHPKEETGPIFNQSAQICELNVWNDASQQNRPKTEEALLARKYFQREEIEAMKMEKLREMAGLDRKKAMSVLNPVVSLLDGLDLNDIKDRELIQEVKSRLAYLGGSTRMPISRVPRSPIGAAKELNEPERCPSAFSPYTAAYDEEQCAGELLLDNYSTGVAGRINKGLINSHFEHRIVNSEAPCQLFGSFMNLREKISDFIDFAKGELTRSSPRKMQRAASNVSRNKKGGGSAFLKGAAVPAHLFAQSGVRTVNKFRTSRSLDIKNEQNAPSTSHGQLPSPQTFLKHRNLKNGLVCAAELGLNEGVEQDALSLPDYVCVSRFPPGIAAVLRKRLLKSFEAVLVNWQEHSLRDLRSNEILSSREKLRLRFTPSPHEDYRLFSVEVDLVTEEDIEIVKTWHPEFKPERHPPSSVNNSATSDSTGPLCLCTVKLIGLLTELPTLIEAFKSLDYESMVKSANISQMMVVFFPEMQEHVLPVSVADPTVPNTEALCHNCVDQLPLNDHAHAAVEVERLNAKRCPWLWPSGITPPTHLHRERRTRDMDTFSKTDVQACEMAILSILKRGRIEYAKLEMASALEGYMQEECLQPRSTVPSAAQVLCITPESRIVNVISERGTDIFDDPDSDLSDTLFGDDPTVDERDLMEDRALAAAARRKKERNAGGGVSGGAATAIRMHDVDTAGRKTLTEEFQELAEIANRENLEAELEAEVEDDFYSAALLEDDGNINNFLSKIKN